MLISIVDDDDSVRKALRRLCSARDLNAETFHSGEAFLDSLIHRHPDCLILDLHMPVLNGLDVLRQLSSLGIRLPTIIITAYDEPETQRLVEDAVTYLRKPVDEKVLISAIERATKHAGRSGPIGTGDA